MVQIHVRAAQHVPVEYAVLDLVLSEGAELPGRGAGKHRENEERDRREVALHRWMLRTRSPWAMAASTSKPAITRPNTVRSEERRVGKECRSRWSPYH